MNDFFLNVFHSFTLKIKHSLENSIVGLIFGRVNVGGTNYCWGACIIFGAYFSGAIIVGGANVMHYEPPGQNVSIVSQICLILVSNCLKRSQFCLKYVSDKMSQFETFLTFEIQLRATWEQFETFFCVVKKVSKRSQKCLKKGFGGI